MSIRMECSDQRKASTKPRRGSVLGMTSPLLKSLTGGLKQRLLILIPFNPFSYTRYLLDVRSHEYYLQGGLTGLFVFRICLPYDSLFYEYDQYCVCCVEY